MGIRRLTEDAKPDLRARTTRGESIRTIAAAYEVADTTVATKLALWGIPPANRPRVDPEIEAEVKRRWFAGESGTIIARAMGQTRNQVVSLANRRGWARSVAVAEANHRDSMRAPAKRRAPKAPAVARDRHAGAGFNLRQDAKAAAADPNRAAAINRLNFQSGPTADLGQEPELVDIPDEGPGLATVLTVRGHMCRWPIGTPGADDFTFCGRDKKRGSYCAGHAQVAYRGTTYASGKELARSLRRFM